MIVDGHGFESVLDGAIKFERKPCLDYRPAGEDRPKLARCGPKSLGRNVPTDRADHPNLCLDPELALDPRIVPSPGLATARLAILADAEGGYWPLAGSKARARQRG